MKILKRLNNIWKLGELNVSKTDNGKTLNLDFSPNEKSKMAQIIKRTTPVQEFLNEEPNE